LKWNPTRCKTSSVGNSAGLSIPRSSVRFQQKLKKLRTQIYIDLRYIDPQARVLKLLFQVIKSIINQTPGQGRFFHVHFAAKFEVTKPTYSNDLAGQLSQQFPNGTGMRTLFSVFLNVFSQNMEGRFLQTRAYFRGTAMDGNGGPSGRRSCKPQYGILWHLQGLVHKMENAAKTAL